MSGSTRGAPDRRDPRSPARGEGGDAGGEVAEAARRAVPARVGMRAALALEQAGELRDAARIFETIGEHAQAAALRLEHARTLDDLDARLASLREGAAMATVDTEQSQALHRALARNLLTALETLPDGLRRRGLLVEAAAALERAGEAEEAGAIYERLGMLRRAAAAYEAGGALADLELVLAVLERQDDEARRLRGLSEEVEAALRAGRRALALDLLAELAGSAGPLARAEVTPGVATGGPDPTWFVRRHAELLAARPSRRRLRLRVSPQDAPGHTLRLHAGPALHIGRAPDAEISLASPGLSRLHARLVAGPAGAELPDGIDAAAGLAIEDLGSRAGTFLDGLPLEPGMPTPLAGARELALGMSTTMAVHADDAGAAVVIDPGDGDVVQFAPAGGPIELRPPGALGRGRPGGREAGDPPILAHLRVDPAFLVLAATRDTRIVLGGEPLGEGGQVELLIGDRIVLEHPELRVVVEVLG